ncbi:MAG: tetratricopeptide repeat protein, partial [Vicinamibacteria bacterium]
REKEILVGRPNEHHLALLANESLLPLETLLTADHASPHYQEEYKRVLFYAQSWAFTHFLQSDPERRELLSKYLTSLEEGDRLEAARRTFGDLDVLRDDLRRYLRRYQFTGVRISRPAPLPEEQLSSRPLSEPEMLAVRGDHLVRIGDGEGGESLLNQGIKRNPGLAEAHESLGFRYFRQGQREKARQSFEEAIRIEPGRYLSHFLLAETLMGDDASARAGAEEHYLQALTLDKEFAPVYRGLSWFYYAQDETPKRSAGLSRQAVAIAPHTAQYRLDWAYFLRELGEIGPAEREAGEAVRMALAAEGPYHANSVCWFGSLYGFASIALASCEAAVTRGPESASFRDSRGLARALTGDLSGAAEDFRFYVEHIDDESGGRKEKRKGWIVALAKGENPFDTSTLRALRTNP